MTLVALMPSLSRMASVFGDRERDSVLDETPANCHHAHAETGKLASFFASCRLVYTLSFMSALVADAPAHTSSTEGLVGRTQKTEAHARANKGVYTHTVKTDHTDLAVLLAVRHSVRVEEAADRKPAQKGKQTHEHMAVPESQTAQRKINKHLSVECGKVERPSARSTNA